MRFIKNNMYIFIILTEFIKNLLHILSSLHAFLRFKLFIAVSSSQDANNKDSIFAVLEFTCFLILYFELQDLFLISFGTGGF